MSDLHQDVFAVSPDIGYVAVAGGQQVPMRSRPGLLNASSSDSDRYEELLVNPTLLPWPPSAAPFDCGGRRYLIVGYGHFQQLVIPRPAGHVSIRVVVKHCRWGHGPSLPGPRLTREVPHGHHVHIHSCRRRRVGVH